MNNKSKQKYNKLELEKALIDVENGASYKEAAAGSLNKSIIAREMRKRKNEKARALKQKNIDILYEDCLKYYENKH